MFKLNAAQRLLTADDIDQHREDDELQTQDFLQQQASKDSVDDSEVETEQINAADTLDAQGQYDLVPYMFAHMLAARTLATRKLATRKLEARNLSKRKLRVKAQQDLPQNQMEHPATQDLDLLLEADSTSDSPFDNFESKSVPNLMYLEDQPDLVRGSDLGSDLDTDLDTSSDLATDSELSNLDYEDFPAGELSKDPGLLKAKSTVDFDMEPGSIDVRFPRDPAPVDGSDYLFVRGESELEAGFDDGQQEAPDMLGSPSEEGEVQILSSDELENDSNELDDDLADESGIDSNELSEDGRESDEGSEVLGDADAKSLWNVANQPLG